MSYTKYHSAWSAADMLSGAAFNHIETQYREAVSDADLHTHDTRYYPKATADVTFFSLSYYTGFDADTVDGQHATDLMLVSLPVGTIMIWSGTDVTIPGSWHICDGGTYGGYATPDLRDRFVMGAGDTYDVGTTGGPTTWNGTITPTGTVTVGSHILTTDELPVHTHSFEEFTNYVNAYSGDNRVETSYEQDTTIDEQAAGGGAHGHSGSSISFTAVDPRPAYYSLYYIMKYA